MEFEGDTVILRVMRGRGTREEILALQAAIRTVLSRAAAGAPAPRRFHLGWRESGAGDHEVIGIGHWASADAVRTADAAGTSPLFLVRNHVRDVEVVHFEVDETIQRRSAEQPIAIRIATGRFSKPGADTEMQNLLRQRAPLIGDEMAEAWVGRRLTGREVEVTFVSAWRRLPDDQPLDAAFWPDIALRYDEFVVEVYAAVGVE